MTPKDRLLEFLKYIKLGQNAFEKKVGISNGYIAHSKGSFGTTIISKIVSAYPELNTEWLLTGVGEMQKAPQNPFSQMTQQQIGDTATKTFTEKLLEAYQAGEIYPATVHNRIVAEKDKRIEELQRENWELKKKVEELSK